MAQLRAAEPASAAALYERLADNTELDYYDTRQFYAELTAEKS